jgi:hypothetical protein
MAPNPMLPLTLPEEVVQRLLPYVDERSLRSLRLRSGRPWRWLPALLRAGATTLGREVCVRPGRCRLDTARGLALVAHEAIHVRQYRELGATRFLLRYIGGAVRVRFAHHAHSMEQEPIAVQRQVREALVAEGMPLN